MRIKRDISIWNLKIILNVLFWMQGFSGWSICLIDWMLVFNIISLYHSGQSTNQHSQVSQYPLIYSRSYWHGQALSDNWSQTWRIVLYQSSHTIGLEPMTLWLVKSTPHSTDLPIYMYILIEFIKLHIVSCKNHNQMKYSKPFIRSAN